MVILLRYHFQWLPLYDVHAFCFLFLVFLISTKERKKEFNKGTHGYLSVGGILWEIIRVGWSVCASEVLSSLLSKQIILKETSLHYSLLL